MVDYNTQTTPELSKTSTTTLSTAEASTSFKGFGFFKA